MIEFFVKHRVTTVIFVLFFIVLGVVSYFDLFIEMMPKIDFPIITITTEYPGATPLEVETQVVKKVEDAVAEISEIKKITSRSYENVGQVMVEFNLSADANIKSIEAKDKIEAIVNDLPSNAKKPLIEKFDVLASPVMDLVLMSDEYDSRDLYEFADKTLKTKLSTIDGVASVDIFGGKERQINILIDPVMARERFIGIDDVIEAIARRNLNLPGGIIEKREDSITVRFMGEFETLDDIRRMELVSRDGARLTIDDIAVVEDGHKDIESVARYDGKEAVGLSIVKTNDGNTVAIARAVEEKLPTLRAMLPEGMQLDVATDNASFVINETNDTLINIALGVLLTVAILYLFTGNLRTTLVAAMVIPTSIVSAVFLIDLSGFSINLMTLMAIAMALGTLIANAIVVIESILEHMERGEEPQAAAVKGTKEVVGAVMASAGTNLVVFTPIAFVAGIAGPFMRQFGLTVVYATIFSLLASFSLTPMLCGLILKRRKVGADGRPEEHRHLVLLTHKAMDYVIVKYRSLFDLTFRHPLITIALVAAMIVGSLMLVPFLGSEFTSSSDENKIIVQITAPQGSTIDYTLGVVGEVEALLEKRPEVKGLLANVGENGVENATLTANLVPVSEREKSDLEIIDELIPGAAEIPGAEIDLMRGRTIKSAEADVSVGVVGNDYERMIDISREMERRMIASGLFRSISSSYKNPKREIRFKPNQEEITTQGIPYAKIARTIRSSIYGDDSNIFKEKGEEYDINVEMDDYYKRTFEDAENINIITSKGLLPITALGELERARAVPTIWHRDKERIIQLDGYLSKGTAGEAMARLDKLFEDIPFEAGEGYRYVGDAENQEESQREIGKAFVLASILTFMVLAAILNSSIHPITIGSSIVTSFVGVFFFMFMSRASFSIISMLAMVMLVGLVVNNSILMLDSALRFLRDGASVKEAVWKGLEEKFRAILMTSLAIVFGVLPQLFSNLRYKADMGVVLIGGMIASIVFTFILTPIIFYYLERIKERFAGRPSEDLFGEE